MLGVDLELLRIERAGGSKELAYRALRAQPEHDRRVAELQVEVDE